MTDQEKKEALYNMLNCYINETNLTNKEIEETETFVEELKEQLILSGVVNCVYVVTERDNYGEQLFRQVFAKKEQAIEYLAKEGLTTSNIDEINEIELD